MGSVNIIMKSVFLLLIIISFPGISYAQEELEIPASAKHEEPVPDESSGYGSDDVTFVDDDEYNYYPSENFNVEFNFYYWMTSLNATLKADSGDLAGSDVDLVSDLGINKNQGFAGGEFILKFWDVNKIRINYVSFDYTASKFIDKDFTFNGQQYSSGTKADTNLHISSLLVTYDIDFYRTRSGFVAFRIGAQTLATKTTIVTNDILSNTASVTVPIPVVGLSGRMNINRHFALSADVTGLSLDKGSLFDWQIFGTYNPVKWGGISLGYRVITFSVDDSGKKGDIDWSGLTLTGSLRF